MESILNKLESISIADPNERLVALKLLVEAVLSSKLPQESVLLVLKFCISQLADDKPELETILSSICSIVNYSPAIDCASEVISALGSLSISSYLFPIRHQVLILLKLLSCDCAEILLVNFYDEKDPRNLLIVFDMSTTLFPCFSPQRQIDIFDYLFRYFPLDFSPPSEDPHKITLESLNLQLFHFFNVALQFIPGHFFDSILKFISTQSTLAIFDLLYYTLPQINEKIIANCEMQINALFHALIMHYLESESLLGLLEGIPDNILSLWRPLMYQLAHVTMIRDLSEPNMQADISTEPLLFEPRFAYPLLWKLDAIVTKMYPCEHVMPVELIVSSESFFQHKNLEIILSELGHNHQPLCDPFLKLASKLDKFLAGQLHTLDIRSLKSAIIILNTLRSMRYEMEHSFLLQLQERMKYAILAHASVPDSTFQVLVRTNLLSELAPGFAHLYDLYQHTPFVPPLSNQCDIQLGHKPVTSSISSSLLEQLANSNPLSFEIENAASMDPCTWVRLALATRTTNCNIIDRLLSDHKRVVRQAAAKRNLDLVTSSLHKC